MALSREVVDFLRTELPAVAAPVVRFVGAIAMLLVLDLLVGALLPVAVLTARFGRASCG